jgi:isopenicillin N synthase-like dioxygenase
VYTAHCTFLFRILNQHIDISLLGEMWELRKGNEMDLRHILCVCPEEPTSRDTITDSTLQVPRDGMCNPLPEGTDIMLPYALSSHRALLKRLMNDLHGIGVIVLRALSTILEVPENKTLEKYHRSDQPSTSSLGVLKYSQLWAESPQLGHSAHTDVGSLTLLFCTEPGLQFFDPSTDEWALVEPKEGHAIVNVGDSLRFLSGSRLKSCLHRVVPYPDARIRDRYSCAYFMRPELDPVFRDVQARRREALIGMIENRPSFERPFQSSKRLKRVLC